MKFWPSKIIFLLSGDIGARFLGFLATVYLARVLGPDGFGYITIGLSVLAYAMWFTDMGITTIGTREFSKPPDQQSWRMYEIIILRLLLAMIVFSAAGLLITWITDIPEAYVIIAFLLNLFSSAILLEWYFQSQVKPAPISFYKTFSLLIYVSLLYAFVRGIDDIIRVPVFFFIGNITAALMLYAFVNKAHRFQIVKIRVNRYKGLLRQSLLIGVGGFCAQIIPNLPPIAAGIIVSAYGAGIFGAAMKITFLGLMLDRIFVFFYLPYVTRLQSKDPCEQEKQLSLILKMIVMTGILACGLIALYSEEIIDLVFSAEYHSAAAVLHLMVWFVFATLLNSFFSYTLIAGGREREYFNSTLQGGGIAALGIVGLTMLGGVEGAAIGMVTGEIVITGFSCRYFTKLIHVRVIHKIFPPVLIMVTMLIVHNYFDFPVWTGLAFTGLYIAVLWFMKYIDKNDLKEISGLA